MAAGALLTVLSNIPWGQVVDNAPKVAEAAGRLWNSVTRRKAREDEAAESLESEPLRGTETERLAARVAATEERVKACEDELQASSQLIKALAEQNTLLVQRLELYRVKLTRVLVAAAAGFVLVLVLVGFLYSR